MENKLLEFQKRIGAIKKDGKNPHFRSSYATLSQILSEVKPILTDLGLTILQPIKDGCVTSILIDGDKTILESIIKLPDNLDPQKLGSAITYYRRYTLASMLALEIDNDDDDANVAAAKKPDLIIGSDIYKQAAKFLKDGGTLIDIEKKYTVSEKCKEVLIIDAS